MAAGSSSRASRASARSRGCCCPANASFNRTSRAGQRAEEGDRRARRRARQSQVIIGSLTFISSLGEQGAQFSNKRVTEFAPLIEKTCIFLIQVKGIAQPFSFNLSRNARRTGTVRRAGSSHRVGTASRPP